MSDAKKYVAKGGIVSLGRENQDLLIDAVRENKFDIADYIIANGNLLPDNAFLDLVPASNKFATKCPSIASAKYLLGKGIKVENARGRGDWSVFYRLAIYEDNTCLNFAQFLLSNGGRELLGKLRDEGHDHHTTAILKSFFDGRKYDMFLLYAKNMDLSKPISKDRHGGSWTIFGLASQRTGGGEGSIKFLRKLLALGAKVSQEDIDVARKNKHLEKALFLQDVFEKQGG